MPPVTGHVEPAIWATSKVPPTTITGVDDAIVVADDELEPPKTDKEYLGEPKLHGEDTYEVLTDFEDVQI